MTALYYERQHDTVRCTLCPHRCTISDGGVGICGVRSNQAGTLALPYYGAASALAIDPIEKKPLYHFFPGSRITSIGFLGCPLRCPFCQNYRISQSTTAPTRYVTPAELIRSACDDETIGIAYTYNEPIIHVEYVLESARLAHEKGLQNVLVTSGQINPEPAAELFAAMDAANIDLKGYSEEFYRRELKGQLQAVKQAIEIAAEHCHVELTTLVIPGKNDSEEEIDAMAEFIAGVGTSIPYHLSAYYPAYHYVTEATRPAVVARLMEVARRRLRFVYSGNLVDEDHTDCPICGRRWVERNRYETRVIGLSDRRCRTCGMVAPLVGVS